MQPDPSQSIHSAFCGVDVSFHALLRRFRRVLVGRCKYKSHGFVTLVVFLSLEVRQGAWTVLIRRGRLVRSQLQRRKGVTPWCGFCYGGAAQLERRV